MNKTIKAGIWIDDYTCWKCNKKIEVLAGVKLQDKVYCISDLNENALNFIKKYFPEEYKKINVKKAKSAYKGDISNFCPHCGAIIGNFYVYDYICLEYLVTGFEGVTSEIKEIDSEETMKII